MIFNSQGYPAWHGDEFAHDLDSTIYFGEYQASSETDGESEVIFGYNLVLILGIVGVVIIVLIKQRRMTKNFRIIKNLQ